MLFLLERHAGIVETHVARDGLREGFLERVHSIVRAEAWGSGRVDLRRPIEVEAHCELGSLNRLHVGESAERHHFIVRIAHMKEADILDLGAVFAFSLDKNLPLPAKAIEVVHKVAAHECLQCLVDCGKIDALGENSVAIDFCEELRHRGQKRAGRGGDLWPPAHGFEEAV